MTKAMGRRLRTAAVGLTVAGLLAACGSSDDGGTVGTDGTATGPKLTATLSGSGSTFQKSYDEAVIEAFTKVQPGITLSYSGGGSGKGKTDLAAGVDQWAGTDSLVKPEDLPKYANGLLYWPTVAAPITLSYKLGGVDSLVLDAPTTAKIYQEQVTTWDDPAIKVLNPKAKLPSTKITPVHRSDASGTTSNFTKWLGAASGGAFTLTVGDTSNWPANELAGNGNSGIAAAIQQTEGSIGYVDFSDAKASGLTFASVVNKAGRAVAPSLAATSAALENVSLDADLTYNPLNAEGDGAYPIATPTWVITAKTYTDANVTAALKALLTYIYGPGQDLAAEVDFARLPDAFVTQAKAQLDELGAP
ncbi:MAG: phosphate ABC transporter substrate-binding protein PstS [Acidimicrobiales bacterium]